MGGGHWLWGEVYPALAEHGVSRRPEARCFIDSLVEFLSTVALGVIYAAVVWHVVDAVPTDRSDQDRDPGRGRVTTRSR